MSKRRGNIIPGIFLFLAIVIGGSIWAYFKFVHWRPLTLAGRNHKTFSHRRVASTFSVDVDTASYSQVRAALLHGQLPIPECIRAEEMLNYFPYNYPSAVGSAPLAIHTEFSGCPWNERHWLLRLGLQTHQLPTDQLPPRNLVFLIDVSGSMTESLPLLSQAFTRLVAGLRAQDRVAIVTYAGNAGLLLEPTSGEDKSKILAALADLQAGGSTHGSDGILKAYALAERHFARGGVNRVILATDGDFNVGITDHKQLVALIEKKRQSGIFLTALGFGQPNDHMLEQLADKGNGNYYFLDSLAEARKVLVKEAGGTLVTLAKDVKVQVEFDPDLVKSSRLIGYENRRLADRDFQDDSKDAGEMGSGHSVTALYELVPGRAHQGDEELAHIKVRYQEPQGGASKLISANVTPDELLPLEKSSDDFRFAAAVAEFAGLLRKPAPAARWEAVARLAKSSRGQDVEGYRAEFVNLVSIAQRLSDKSPTALGAWEP